MIAKLKQCCECPEGKLSILWKSNPPLCRYHAQMRTAKKKITEKKREGSKLDNDNKFYEYVWKIREHFCHECGKEITEMKKWYMHHILPKSKYPYFRHDERNILMLCYQHHNEIESAISAPKMKVFPITEKIKEQLLSEVGLTYEPKH